MSDIEVKVPSLGESITEAVIAKWLKKEGDLVEKDEIIVELETDKVTQEIYAPKQGIISKIFFQEGEEVQIGEVIVNINEDNNQKKNFAHVKQKTEKLEGKQKDIIVPSLGESITEATISKLLLVFITCSSIDCIFLILGISDATTKTSGFSRTASCLSLSVTQCGDVNLHLS